MKVTLSVVRVTPDNKLHTMPYDGGLGKIAYWEQCEPRVKDDYCYQCKWREQND
jgi:hypothetical protein